MDETEKTQDEVEVSLFELAEELIRHWFVIATIVIACGAVAAFYAYATLAPVSYQYLGRLRLPINTGAWQINTCVEVLRCDIGAVPGLNAVWQGKNSHVLILEFRGPEGSALRAQATQYLLQAKAKADDLLLGQLKADFERNIIKELQRDMAALKADEG